MLTPDGRSVRPLEEVLPAGAELFRVHQDRFGPADFNPGTAPGVQPTRFAFFGDPPVPVLYAADHPMAAISETLLHDVPVTGGALSASSVRTRVLSALEVVRDLRLVALHGDGFRRIGTAADRITRTPSSAYTFTVQWAQAAHDAGYDGMVWMSRHFDTARSCVIFDPGDASPTVRAHPDPDLVRPFAFEAHLDWLTTRLAPLNVHITLP